MSKPRESVGFVEATSGRRIWARLMDLFLVFVIWGVVVGVLLAFARDWRDVGAVALTATSVLAPIVYDAVLLRLFGRTLGMRVAGLRVTDARGERLGWGRCLLRTVALYVSLVVVIAGTVATASVIGWIIVLGLPKYSRFPHDKISQSYVWTESKGELAEAGLEPAGQPGPQPGTPSADLERLRTDRIISEEEYLRKKRELGF